jgi:hypothetical protein
VVPSFYTFDKLKLSFFFFLENFPISNWLKHEDGGHERGHNNGIYFFFFTMAIGMWIMFSRKDTDILKLKICT